MIQNIIFDLGGVILNLDMSKTVEAFTRLGWKDADWRGISQSGYLIFENLETGEDTIEQFRKGIRKMLPGNPADSEIDFAWNAMLIDFPSGIIDYLIDLKSRYKLYIFSNTNELHLKRFRDIFFNSYGYPFDNLFDGTYYSHEIGDRKPNPGAFLAVMKDASLIPSETLFVDDLKANTDAAMQLGLNVLHIQAGTLMNNLPAYLESLG